MYVMGINRIERDVIKILERIQLSKALIKKIKKLSKDNVLPSLIFESGDISDTGREFCIAIYIAYGKDPLLFLV